MQKTRVLTFVKSVAVVNVRMTSHKSTQKADHIVGQIRVHNCKLGDINPYTIHNLHNKDLMRCYLEANKCVYKLSCDFDILSRGREELFSW